MPLKFFLFAKGKKRDWLYLNEKDNVLYEIYGCEILTRTPL